MSEISELVVGQSVKIGKYNVIGASCGEKRRLSRTNPGQNGQQIVYIGDNTIIGHQNIIYQGVKIGKNCVIEDGNQIGESTSICNDVRVCYSSIVGDDVYIEDECIIGGFVCDETIIRRGSRVFGKIVHGQSSPHIGWWDVTEEAPEIGRFSFIGAGAILIGGISIGDFCYVTAGSVVTKSVPPKTIVIDRDSHIPLKEWRGSSLRHWISWVDDYEAN